MLTWAWSQLVRHLSYKETKVGSIPITPTTCTRSPKAGGVSLKARAVWVRVPPCALRGGSSMGQNPRLINGHVLVRIRVALQSEHESLVDRPILIRLRG